MKLMHSMEYMANAHHGKESTRNCPGRAAIENSSMQVSASCTSRSGPVSGTSYPYEILSIIAPAALKFKSTKYHYQAPTAVRSKRNKSMLTIWYVSKNLGACPTPFSRSEHTESLPNSQIRLLPLGPTPPSPTALSREIVHYTESTQVSGPTP